MSNENENAPPPYRGAIGAQVLQQHAEAQQARDKPFADLLHRALAARYGVNPKPEEEQS